MKTIFNKNIVDYTKEPLFLGQDLSVQRYDTFKFPVFDKLNEQMLGFFWRPQEISLQKDRSDYLDFRPEQKFIFTNNLSYQILLDSVQGRSPSSILLPLCSNPELEGCLITWTFFEAIHSRAYTHIIKNVYPDPSVVFDQVLKNEQIIKRATSVTRHYDELYEMSQRYFLNGEGTLRQLKKKLALTIISINALEGVRFYLSFACTFAFAENKLMEGSAKEIALIARDENQHLALTQHIIKIWQKGQDDPEMAEILVECKDEIMAIYEEVRNEEKEWGRYLFSEGSLLGLNEKLASDYIDFTVDRRLKAIGLQTLSKVKTNPLPWTQHWLNSKDVQTANQETENESYLVGAIKADINISQFGGFSL